MCEEEEIIEEENPQLPAAFGFVKPAAVEQLARPEAISQRVEDQVLEEREEGCREGRKLSSTASASVKNCFAAVCAFVLVTDSVNSAVKEKCYST